MLRVRGSWPHLGSPLSLKSESPEARSASSPSSPSVLSGRSLEGLSGAAPLKDFREGEATKDKVREAWGLPVNV